MSAPRPQGGAQNGTRPQGGAQVRPQGGAQVRPQGTNGVMPQGQQQMMMRGYPQQMYMPPQGYNPQMRGYPQQMPPQMYMPPQGYNPQMRGYAGGAPPFMVGMQPPHAQGAMKFEPGKEFTPGAKVAAGPAAPAAAAQTATANAKPRTPYVKRERKALKIVNPDTKEEVKVVQSPPPKKEEAKELPAVEAAKAAAVAPDTPNTARKKKTLEIKAPDGAVVKPAEPAAAPAAEAKEIVAAPAAKATAPMPAAPTSAAAAAAAAPAKTKPEPSRNTSYLGAITNPPPAKPAAAAPAPSGPDGGDAAAAADGESPFKNIKVDYEEGQWSPANQAGKKKYGPEFMFIFKRACKAFSEHPVYKDQPKLDKDSVPSAPKGGNSSGSAGFAVGFGNMGSGGGPRNRSRGGPGDQRQGSGSFQRGQGGNFQGGGNFQRGQGVGGGTRGGSGGGGPRRQITLPAREKVTLHTTKNSWKGGKSTGPADPDADPLKPANAILNKLTLEKFDTLSKGLLELLLKDLHNLLEKFTAMLFGKAVDEPFFSVVYAKLCRALADLIQDPEVNFKKMILNQCQKHFEAATKADAAAKMKETKKTPEEIKEEEAKVARMGNIELKAYEKQKREDDREAVLAVAKLKRHVLGNITFIGELFKMDMVPDKIMTYCIDHLFENAKDEALEANLEQLCKLLDTAGGKLEKKFARDKKKKKSDSKAMADNWENYFKKLKAITGQKGLNSRIKFAIQDVLDLRQRSWQARMENKGPKTIAEIHAAAKQEQLTIQMNNSGPQRGGGGGGGVPHGRNSRGRDGGRGIQGGMGRPGGRNSQGSKDQWQVVDSRKEKVDAGKMFGGLKGLGALDGGGGLSLGGGGLSLGGGGKLGGARGWGSGKASGGGVTADGKYTKNKNLFGLLDTDAQASQKAKNSPLLKRVTQPKGPTPTPEQVCKFSDDELELKIKGSLKEYLSIKSLEEVQLSLTEWGAIVKVHKKFLNELFNMAIEARDGERKSLQELLQKIVGKDIPGSTFHAVCVDFLEFVPDLMIDSPKAHQYTAQLIAAGIDADPKVAGIIRKLSEKPAQDQLYGDLALKLGLEICAAVKLLQDEARMVAMFASLDISLGQLLDPKDDERVADLADRVGLKVLLTAAAAGAGDDLAALTELIGSGANSDAIIEAVDKVEAKADQGSATFVHALNTALMAGITAKTTVPAASESVSTPTKEAEAAEEKLVADLYKPVMLRIVDNKEDLQLHILCSIQTFAQVKGQPPALVDRWFHYMYDVDLVTEAVFNNYKVDEAVSKSPPYEGKNQALNTATSIYATLAQPEEEDGGEN